MDLSNATFNNWGDGKQVIAETYYENGHRSAQSEEPVPLTGALASEEAMVYWVRLEQGRFVNSDHMLLETTTRQQAMYIAEMFAEKIGLKTKWKPFEMLWGINHLAQEKNKLQETGKLPSRSNEIDTIFGD